uniref:G-protein coupled receptors family 1 profile domain-containing protein n=1 Tax=Panagrolaimus sp. PS1159 TaxID=55785 RepID=A0AC35GD77_9BILA
MVLQGDYEVTDVLPPPNHEDLHVLIMAVGYMLLFLFGTCGNVAVLTTIYHVVRSRRANLDNTLIYVIVLSCVDFGVCLSLPFTVIDQILGFWMFGSIVCKLHAVLENFGKVLSALILTAMSFDRFAGVCHPQKRWLRSTSLAVCILFGLAAYALVTLCPLLWSFTSRELVLFEKETAPRKKTRMRIEKCTMVNITSTVFTMFTVFLFVLCYLIPLFLVAFFYSKLLSKLRQHARQFTASHIPLMRISLYTLAVACFYFLCWTPFWVATAYAVYLEYTEDPGARVPPVFVYCMYFIHALPFTNSAVNWILYGALNSQLQHRYRGGRNTDTTMANGFSTCPTMKIVPSIHGISTTKTNETQYLTTMHSENGCMQIPNGNQRTNTLTSLTTNNENPPDPSPQSNSSTPLLVHSNKQKINSKTSSSIVESNGNITATNNLDDTDDESVNFDMYLNGQQEATFL